jgi:hypothetical protein
VDEDAFEEVLLRLVLDAPLTLRPSQAGWWVRASYPDNDVHKRPEHLLRKSFGGVCKAGQRGEDCLLLLDVAGLVTWVALAANPEPVFT